MESFDPLGSYTMARILLHVFLSCRTTGTCWSTTISILGEVSRMFREGTDQPEHAAQLEASGGLRDFPRRYTMPSLCWGFVLEVSRCNVDWQIDGLYEDDELPSNYCTPYSVLRTCRLVIFIFSPCCRWDVVGLLSAKSAGSMKCPRPLRRMQKEGGGSSCGWR
jgi:hypothetical protein